MENASKALLMAAGVLIGILILTLAVYLFINFGGTSATIHNRIQKDQINKFNSQFTKYEGKDNVTIYDVITIANLATENNITNELARNPQTRGTDNYITVILDSKPIEGDINSNLRVLEADYNKKIKEDIEQQIDNQLKRYNVRITISNVTERVFLIEITK